MIYSVHTTIDRHFEPIEEVKIKELHCDAADYYKSFTVSQTVGIDQVLE